MDGLRAAFGLLTVLPVGTGTGEPPARRARVFFPVVGLVTGMVGAVVYAAVVAAFGGHLLAAILAIGGMVVLTGAMHVDGLADSADGLFGGGTREARLAILADPRLGTFGTVSIVLVLAGEAAALSALNPAQAAVALVLAGVVSRSALLALLGTLPYVRTAGLGHAMAGPPGWVEWAVAALLVAALLPWDSPRGLLAVVLVAVAVWGLARLALTRLGGLTGDVLGAAAELSQLATLLAFATGR